MDVTTTDVDVILLFGSSYCFAAAAEIAGAWAEVAATMIAATTAVSGSSSYCFAVVVDVETAAANSTRKRGAYAPLFLFYILFSSTLHIQQTADLIHHLIDDICLIGHLFDILYVML